MTLLIENWLGTGTHAAVDEAYRGSIAGWHSLSSATKASNDLLPFRPVMQWECGRAYERVCVNDKEKSEWMRGILGRSKRSKKIEKGD